MGRILHIERSTFFRKVFREIAREHGYETIEADTPDEALEMLEQDHCDLVVAGIELEKGTAEDVILRINDTPHAKTPVLIITSNDSLEIREKYFSLGVSDYILKHDLTKGALSKFLARISQTDAILDNLKAVNIAVLDDSAVTLKVVARLFEMNGLHHVDYFNNPEDLFNSRKHYALLLVDIIMPGHSGNDIIARYRQRCDKCIIICISSIQNTKTISNILSAGANDYLIKPFDAEIFIARIRANFRTFMLVQELEDKKRILEKLAVTDGLTDTFNHNHILWMLKDEVKKAIAGKTAVSIIMMDIDHFKKVNDIYGHVTGDRVLVQTAHTLKTLTRDKDLIGRYGGEEFLIILPGTGKRGAVTVAENIREQVEREVFMEDSLKVTISGGVAGLEDPVRGSAEEIASALVEAADKLLYESKKNGRNRISY